MYKGIHNNNNELNFNPVDKKKKQDEEKEKHYSTSNDYETIRLQVKGTHKQMKKNDISDVISKNVEVIAKTLGYTLIDGISFKLSKTASYITSRSSCTYPPQGTNIYTPENGTKLVKININGSDWLDSSTFRIMFDSYNTNGNATHRLRPIGGPWSLLGRMSI